MGEVTKLDANSYLFKHTFSNGAVLAAKFSDRGAEFINLERNYAPNQIKLKEISEKNKKEWIEAHDQLQRERLKAFKFASAFVAKDTLAVQGGKVVKEIFSNPSELTELKQKYNLSDADLETKAMTTEHRLSLKPRLFATIGPSNGELGSGAADDMVVSNKELAEKYGIDAKSLEATGEPETGKVAPTPLTPKEPASEEPATDPGTTASPTPTPSPSPVARKVDEIGKNTSAPLVQVAYTATGKSKLPLTLKYMLDFKDQDIQPGAGSNPVYVELNRMLARNAGYTLSDSDDDMMCAFGANAVANMVARANGRKLLLPEKTANTSYKTDVIWADFGRELDHGEKPQQGDWISFNKKKTGLGHIGVYVGETATDWIVAGFRNTIWDKNGKIIESGVRVVRIPKTYRPEFRRQEYSGAAFTQNIAE